MKRCLLLIYLKNEYLQETPFFEFVRMLMLFFSTFGIHLSFFAVHKLAEKTQEHLERECNQKNMLGWCIANLEKTYFAAATNLTFAIAEAIFSFQFHAAEIRCLALRFSHDFLLFKRCHCCSKRHHFDMMHFFLRCICFEVDSV